MLQVRVLKFGRKTEHSHRYTGLTLGPAVKRVSGYGQSFVKCHNATQRLSSLSAAISFTGHLDLIEASKISRYARVESSTGLCMSSLPH